MKEFELIADKCEAFMKKSPEWLTPLKDYQLYRLIKTEIQNEPASYKNVSEAKELLELVLNDIPERERIYNLIYTKIQNATSEFKEIFRDLYKIYVRNGRNCRLLVRAVYSIEIIRFICHAEHSIVEPIRENKKQYDSLKRARGFCLLLILKENGTTADQLGMTKLKKFSKKYFPEQSDQTMYKLLLSGRGLTLDQAKDHQLDYDYGLILFNSITNK